nr:MAG TPA: hypothetical protein [Caudoviricetes sp.]
MSELTPVIICYQAGINPRSTPHQSSFFEVSKE